MSDVEQITHASQLWKLMTDAQRRQAAEAFWAEGEAGAEHAQGASLGWPSSARLAQKASGDASIARAG